MVRRTWVQLGRRMHTRRSIWRSKQPPPQRNCWRKAAGTLRRYFFTPLKLYLGFFSCKKPPPTHTHAHAHAHAQTSDCITSPNKVRLSPISYLLPLIFSVIPYLLSLSITSVLLHMAHHFVGFVCPQFVITKLYWNLGFPFRRLQLFAVGVKSAVPKGRGNEAAGVSFHIRWNLRCMPRLSSTYKDRSSFAGQSSCFQAGPRHSQSYPEQTCLDQEKPFGI